MLQGLNKLKNYRLRWLSKPLRLAKFESLESKYVLQWLFLGYWTIFLFLLLLSLSFLTEFSQRFYSDSFFLNPPSTVGCFPFYSVILGFQGTVDSPILFLWVPKPMSCQSLRWLVPSFFLIVFFFWCLYPKNFSLTFLSGVSLESWLLISLPSRLLHLTFSDSTFWLPFVLSFFSSELIPFLLGWKFSQLLPFMVLLSGFLEVPTLCSWIVSPKLSDSFLHHWVADKEVFVLHSLCFLGTFFESS